MQSRLKPALSSRTRKVLRDHEASQPVSVKGHSCAVCGALGDHFEDQCPSKALTGMPEVQRQAQKDSAILEAYGSYECAPTHLSGPEFVHIVRSRMDVPLSLRCYVCTLLMEDAGWCSKCNRASCTLCLAPIDQPWVCSSCSNCDQDAFHVVDALRDLAIWWLETMTAAIDARNLSNLVSASKPEPVVAHGFGPR